MSKKPTAAKAVATIPAAKAKERLIPEHLLVPLNPPDWPTNLTDEQAEWLFEFMEEGGFLKDAAKVMGIKKSTLSQWKRRHKQFGIRLNEAEEIGAEALVEVIDDYAKDIKTRDEAICAKEKRENRMEIVRAKWPHKYKLSPFNTNAIQVNVGVNFEQELLAARNRAFAERGITITVNPADEPTDR